ncbi:hypothetical protein N0V90_010114 [Kalmusia sp. IMI 367209]|nr:hypothetical protein N0V90_010114 [Kalmusia sp. IMI 367209]
MASNEKDIGLPGEKIEAINDTAGTHINPVAEKKLLRKCDIRVLPPLFMLFLLAFLDRTNIGNAKIQGMTKDLNMVGADYNIALFVFFIPYYKRYELQWRFTLFFTASIIAGGFGGLFAFALAKMNGIGGYAGWRWIFIIEGLLTIVLGIIAKFWVIDWPETAKFLNEDERALLIARLTADTGDATMNHLDKRAARRIFSDLKIYLGTIMYFGIVNTGYAGSFFIPTIIKELGYTSSAAQVRSIPIFVVATCTAIIAAYFTDRLRHRFWFCIFGLVVASVGYILLLCGSNLSAGVKYFALFLIVPGGYITQPIVLVWMSNLVSGHYKRSVSSAMQVGLGNIGGIVASNVFFESEAKNARYPTGYGVSLGMLWICGAATVVLFWYVKRENRKRERGERDWRLEGDDRENLGDDHPHFRFTT